MNAALEAANQIIRNYNSNHPEQEHPCEEMTPVYGVGVSGDSKFADIFKE